MGLSIPKRPPHDWRKKFPGSSAHALDLLQGLLQFDCRKRITVDQALAHLFLRNVRDQEAEVRHKQIKFDFEDIPLQIRTIKELIIDEIMIWNPPLVNNLVVAADRKKGRPLTRVARQKNVDERKDYA